MATAFDLLDRRDSAILPVVPASLSIACPPQPWQRPIDLVFVDLCLPTDLDFRRASVVDSSAAHFSLAAAAVDWICPANLFRSRIGSAIAPADFVAVDFDLYRRSCSGIATVAAGPADSGRRYFAADLF